MYSIIVIIIIIINILDLILCNLIKIDKQIEIKLNKSKVSVQNQKSHYGITQNSNPTLKNSVFSNTVY